MNMDSGVKAMVSGPASDEVEIVTPIEHNSFNARDKMKKPARSTFIWDANKKRPSTILMVILIVFTMTFLVYGIVDTVNSFHEIEIVIDSNDRYSGSIHYGDTYDNLRRDDGRREFSYTIRRGTTIYINIYISNTPTDLMTIQIYDNGDTVVDHTPAMNLRTIDLEYTVGE
jgi:hypothetical protein